MVTASTEILVKKVLFSFIQTFIKGIAGNFYVCLAIFLQLMAKPLHVKFLMMVLPIFTFVSLGFTHSVADMYVIVLGLINGAPVSVATVAWKLFLPAALGNMVGGSFFGVVITWYLHIFVVEEDRKALDLPQYELRDEQPELNQDSRVVRQKKAQFDEDAVKLDENNGESDETQQDDEDDLEPIPIYDEVSIPSAITQLRPSLSRSRTRSSVSTRRKSIRSPKNVFPVYGMGTPLQREKTIAGQLETRRSRTLSDGYPNDKNESEPEADYIGAQLKRALTHKPRRLDLESGNISPGALTPTSSFIRRKSNQSDRSSLRLSAENSNQEKDLGDDTNASKENLDRILE